MIVRLTSAVGTGRPAVYVNTDQIISFSDQSGGGCQIRVGAANGVIVVSENAETVAQKIADLTRR